MKKFQVKIEIGLVYVTVLEDRVIVELCGLDAGDTFTDVIPLTADAMQEIAGKISDQVNANKGLDVQVFMPETETVH